MLAYVLALVVGSGSFALYMAAFFFPEVHRKNDFIWSGIGLFYALVLWVCAERIRGGVLLGQTASVAILAWLGWQVLMMRRQVAPSDEQTPTPTPDEVKETLSSLTNPETWSKVAGQVRPQMEQLGRQAQELVGIVPKPKTAPKPVKKDNAYVPLTPADFASARRSLDAESPIDVEVTEPIAEVVTDARDGIAEVVFEAEGAIAETVAAAQDQIAQIVSSADDELTEALAALGADVEAQPPSADSFESALGDARAADGAATSADDLDALFADEPIASPAADRLDVFAEPAEPMTAPDNPFPDNPFEEEKAVDVALDAIADMTATTTAASESVAASAAATTRRVVPPSPEQGQEQPTGLFAGVTGFFKGLFKPKESKPIYVRKQFRDDSAKPVSATADPGVIDAVFTVTEPASRPDVVDAATQAAVEVFPEGSGTVDLGPAAIADTPVTNLSEPPFVVTDSLFEEEPFAEESVQVETVATAEPDMNELFADGIEPPVETSPVEQAFQQLGVNASTLFPEAMGGTEDAETPLEEAADLFSSAQEDLDAIDLNNLPVDLTQPAGVDDLGLGEVGGAEGVADALPQGADLDDFGLDEPFNPVVEDFSLDELSLMGESLLAAEADVAGGDQNIDLSNLDLSELSPGEESLASAPRLVDEGLNVDLSELTLADAAGAISTDGAFLDVDTTALVDASGNANLDPDLGDLLSGLAIADEAVVTPAETGELDLEAGIATAPAEGLVDLGDDFGSDLNDIDLDASFDETFDESLGLDESLDSTGFTDSGLAAEGISLDIGFDEPLSEADELAVLDNLDAPFAAPSLDASASLDELALDENFGESLSAAELGDISGDMDLGADFDEFAIAEPTGADEFEGRDLAAGFDESPVEASADLGDFNLDADFDESSLEPAAGDISFPLDLGEISSAGDDLGAIADFDDAPVVSNELGDFNLDADLGESLLEPPSGEMNFAVDFDETAIAPNETDALAAITEDLAVLAEFEQAPESFLGMGAIDLESGVSASTLAESVDDLDLQATFVPAEALAELGEINLETGLRETAPEPSVDLGDLGDLDLVDRLDDTTFGETAFGEMTVDETASMGLLDVEPESPEISLDEGLDESLSVVDDLGGLDLGPDFGETSVENSDLGAIAGFDVTSLESSVEFGDLDLDAGFGEETLDAGASDLDLDADFGETAFTGSDEVGNLGWDSDLGETAIESPLEPSDLLDGESDLGEISLGGGLDESLSVVDDLGDLDLGPDFGETSVENSDLGAIAGFDESPLASAVELGDLDLDASLGEGTLETEASDLDLDAGFAQAADLDALGGLDLEARLDETLPGLSGELADLNLDAGFAAAPPDAVAELGGLNLDADLNGESFELESSDLDLEASDLNLDVGFGESLAANELGSLNLDADFGETSLGSPSELDDLNLDADFGEGLLASEAGDSGLDIATDEPALDVETFGGIGLDASFGEDALEAESREISLEPILDESLAEAGALSGEDLDAVFGEPSATEDLGDLNSAADFGDTSLETADDLSNHGLESRWDEPAPDAALSDVSSEPGIGSSEGSPLGIESFLAIEQDDLGEVDLEAALGRVNPAAAPLEDVGFLADVTENEATTTDWDDTDAVTGEAARGALPAGDALALSPEEQEALNNLNMGSLFDTPSPPELPLADIPFEETDTSRASAPETLDAAGQLAALDISVPASGSQLVSAESDNLISPFALETPPDEEAIAASTTTPEPTVDRAANLDESGLDESNFDSAAATAGFDLLPLETPSFEGAITESDLSAITDSALSEEAQAELPSLDTSDTDFGFGETDWDDTAQDVASSAEPDLDLSGLDLSGLDLADVDEAEATVADVPELFDTAPTETLLDIDVPVAPDQLNEPDHNDEFGLLASESFGDEGAIAESTDLPELGFADTSDLDLSDFGESSLDLSASTAEFDLVTSDTSGDDGFTSDSADLSDVPFESASDLDLSDFGESDFGESELGQDVAAATDDFDLSSLESPAAEEVVESVDLAALDLDTASDLEVSGLAEFDFGEPSPDVAAATDDLGLLPSDAFGEEGFTSDSTDLSDEPFESASDLDLSDFGASESDLDVLESSADFDLSSLESPAAEEVVESVDLAALDLDTASDLEVSGLAEFDFGEPSPDVATATDDLGLLPSDAFGEEGFTSDSADLSDVPFESASDLDLSDFGESELGQDVAAATDEFDLSSLESPAAEEVVESVDLAELDLDTASDLDLSGLDELSFDEPGSDVLAATDDFGLLLSETTGDEGGFAEQSDLSNMTFESSSDLDLSGFEESDLDMSAATTDFDLSSLESPGTEAAAAESADLAELDLESTSDLELSGVDEFDFGETIPDVSQSTDDFGFLTSAVDGELTSDSADLSNMTFDTTSDLDLSGLDESGLGELELDVSGFDASGFDVTELPLSETEDSDLNLDLNLEGLFDDSLPGEAPLNENDLNALFDEDDASAAEIIFDEVFQEPATTPEITTDGTLELSEPRLAGEPPRKTDTDADNTFTS